MPVIDMWQAAPENTANATLETREYTAAVYVRTDDPADTGHAVLEHMIANGYGYGSTYNAGNDANPLARIYQIDPPQLIPGSCDLWKAVARYRLLTPEEKDLNDQSPGNPVDLRPKISTSTVVREVPVDKATYRSGFHADVGLSDGDFSPIINSAKTILIPQPLRQKSNRILTITRNALAVTFSDTSFPEDWINDVAVTVSDRQTTVEIPIYGMKFLRWATSPQYHEGLDYVEVTGEFEVTWDEGGWRQDYRDEGIQCRAEAGDPDGRGGTISASDIKTGAPQIRRMIDQFGLPLPEPVRLDGNGKPLAPGDDTVYSTWSLLEEIDPKTLPFFAGIMV